MTVERLELMQCQYCNKVEDITELVCGSVILCTECLAKLNEIARFPGSWSNPVTYNECPSCSGSWRKLLKSVQNDGKIAPHLGAEILIVAELTICKLCLWSCNSVLERRDNFFKEQAPECGPENCIESNCESLRIRNALRCIKHQFAWGFRRRWVER